MRRTIKLSISKTDEEWDIIEQKIGGKSLTDYVWPEVNKLLKQFEDCNECLKKAKRTTTEKRPYLPTPTYTKLSKFAKKIDVSPSTIVDILIIQPLLSRE